MAQPRTAQPRKSDFPIFEYLEAANPLRLWWAYQAMHPRVRLTMFLLLVALVLAWSLLTLAQVGYNLYLENARPVLTAALQSRYGLEGRAFPPLTADGRFVDILPATVEGYNLQQRVTAQVFVNAEYERITEEEAKQAEIAALHVTLAEKEAAYAALQAVPVTDEVNSDARAGAEQQSAAALAVDPILLDTAFQEVETARAALTTAQSDLNQMQTHVGDRLGKCLLSAGVTVDFIQPCLTPWAYYVEGGIYTDGTATVHVAAADFERHALASQAIRDLFGYNRQIGRTGDFTFGVVDVDYYYGAADNNFSFAWAKGPWVYIVTASSLQTLEEFVRAMPY